MNHRSRLLPTAVACAAAVLTLPSAAAAQDRERPAGPPELGKYGCSESVYSASTGSFTFEPRGFVTLLPRGRYRQGTGAVGTYRYKAGSGRTTFKGGGLDGTYANAIDGKRTRLQLHLLLDGERDAARWACTHLKKG